ncbi:MAG: SDR family oxidoreductase [Rhodospirillales bacterium]|jgi:nucleoside-diphosphate-sugar epimerase|nr:SDR family oxidoreductase [Rhodospirillales bacterium]
MRVLVTGATGFVGNALIPDLLRAGHSVRAAVWSDLGGDLAEGASAVEVGDIGPETNWDTALQDVEGIIHLAARAHVMDETSTDPMAAYRRINTAGTQRLAEAAARTGVRRFVFLSSIKVNGERTDGCPFNEAFVPAPEDAYGITKLEAEQALKAEANRYGMQTAVLRSPLVYGPDVKGNFLRLLGICQKGLPLPLSAIRNARSLIYVGNLANVLRTCLDHEAAAGETFLISDGAPVSTPDLLRGVAAALGTRARLFPAPEALLRGAAGVLGKSAMAERLIGSLAVDDRKIRKILAWHPPFSMLEGLRETAAWYHTRGRSEGTS